MTTQKAPHTRAVYCETASGGFTRVTMQMVTDLRAEGWQGDARYMQKDGFYSLDEAIAQWEAITGLRADEPGCECCGCPHDFVFYVDDRYVGGSECPDEPTIPHEQPIEVDDVELHEDDHDNGW